MISRLKIQPSQVGLLNPADLFNINLGVLGHVDSGKTSICQALTMVLSTACHDKSPQSQARGITLDLGFSALYTRRPQHFKCQKKYLQITLVDCPGHASLIRTIVGGAQIIDFMVLVLDINKGIQTQTAQCLMIAQLLIAKMVVILNKVDMIPQAERQKTLQKRIEALRKIFSKTKFGADVPMVVFSALEKDKQKMDQQTQNLMRAVLYQCPEPTRKADGPFYALIDHCFLLKGKGCVLTGTIVQGSLKVGDQIEIPQNGQKRKIKSIQIFHKPTQRASQGDRMAALVSVLEGQKLQRCTLTVPGLFKPIQSAIVNIDKIPYFKMAIKSKSKFHIITGHQTIMGQLRLFLMPEKALGKQSLRFFGSKTIRNAKEQTKEEEFTFDTSIQYESVDDYQQAEKHSQVFARISFQKPILAYLGSFLIGSKLDVDVDSNQCRLAFHSTVLSLQAKQKLKLFRLKERTGVIDRIADQHYVIVKELFPKEFDLHKVIKEKVRFSDDQEGEIVGPFGKSGKLKVWVGKAQTLQVESKVTYRYKKYYLQ